MRWALALALILLGGLIVAGVALVLPYVRPLVTVAQDVSPEPSYQFPVTTSAKAAGVSTIEVRVRAGSVRLAASARPDIQVAAVRHISLEPLDRARAAFARTDVKLTRAGGTLSIVDVAPDDWRIGGEPVRQHLVLTVSVPSGKSAKVLCPVGDINLSGRFAAADAHVNTGSIDCASVVTEFGLSLSCDIGEVKVSDGAGGGPVGVAIGTGTADIGLASVPRRGASIGVGSGGVHLALPAGAGAEVGCSVATGTAKSTLPGVSSERVGFVGARLRGRIGAGGPKVTATVGVGTLTLVPREAR
jgi:hypothetical protein